MARRSTPTRRSARRAAMRTSRARSSSRPPRSMPRSTSASAMRVATSCHRSWPPGRADSAGCGTPRVAWMSAGRRRPSRSRAHVRSGCARPSAAWKKRANEAYEDYRRHGRMKNGRRLGAHSPPKPYQPPERPEGKINLTDLDSRNVKTPRGWVQGYNAQAVTTEDQIVIAAEVHVSSADFGQLEPMVAAARRELARAGVEEAPDVVLADAGYWHQVQMQRLAGEGLTVLVPPDASKRGGPRPGWDGGLYAFMRRVLATDRGGALYAKRRVMIEPVFADTKFNRGIDRFLRRGRAAARSEWRLTNAAHNLLKLWRHTTAPAAA